MSHVEYDRAVEEAMLKELKLQYPNLFIDRIPFIKDSDGMILNQDEATELNRFQKRALYGIQPDKKPVIVGWLPNRLGKSYVIAIHLTLLILEDHPKLHHEGIKGDYLLMTNAKLLKTEYPKVLFSNPGFLGQYDEYIEDYKDANGKVLYRNCRTVVNSKGEKFVLRVSKDSEGMLEFIENITTGKRIRFFSYTQNYQVIAGQSFLSAFLDEVGDDTKTDKAKGANALTVDKFQELLVRVGSQQALKDNFIVMMLFSLTLNNMWLEDLVEQAKDGLIIVPEINPNEQCVDLIQGFTAKDNPYYNPRTFNLALGISKFLGEAASRNMERRLIDTGMEDTQLVFPRGRRPIPIESNETDKYIHRWKTSKHEWEFDVCVDPGMSDKMGVLFALIHPVEGIIICRNIYKSRMPVQQASQLILDIEMSVFGETPKHRWFDKHSISKTTQEKPLPNRTYWAKHLGKPPENACQPDRSYDRMFELIGKSLIKYDKTHCEDLEYELRKHKNDPRTGLPKEADPNHLIDCFTGDSLIETLEGVKPIKTLTNKDFVLTSEGYRPIKWVGISKHQSQYLRYNIITDKGEFTLKCTQNHLVKGDTKWQEISTLRQGDKIYLSRSLKDRDITFMKEKNTTQKEIKGFIELYGSFLMEKFQKGFMFITKMAIHITTVLEILNLLTQFLINQNIQESIIEKIQSLLKLISQEIKTNVENGIDQKQVRSGTEKMEKNGSLNMQKNLLMKVKESVLSVIKNFSLLQLTVNSVQVTVNLIIEELYQKITLQKHVKSVENLSHNMTSTNPHFAQVLVLSVTEQKEESLTDLYDIEVLGSQHEFVVNGILVHNCMRYLSNAFYEKHYKRYHKAEGALDISETDPALREYQLYRNFALNKLKNYSSSTSDNKIFGYSLYTPKKR